MAHGIAHPLVARDHHTRVAIIDDHDLLAQSLAMALDRSGFETITVKPSDNATMLSQLRAAGTELVLLDLDLGETPASVLSLIGELRTGGATVLMLTGITDRPRLAECVEAGAMGILAKSLDVGRLITAIEDASRGRPLLTAVGRDDLLAALRSHRARNGALAERFAQLSVREREVLNGLVQGMSVDEIATEGFVSVSTVRSHVKAVLRKLGVRSQLAAVALAHELGSQADEGTGDRTGRATRVRRAPGRRRASVLR